MALGDNRVKGAVDRHGYNCTVVQRIWISGRTVNLCAAVDQSATQDGCLNKILNCNRCRCIGGKVGEIYGRRRRGLRTVAPAHDSARGEAEIGKWDLLGNRDKAGVIGAVVADDDCVQELFGSSCRLWRRGYAQLHICRQDRSQGRIRVKN